MLASNAGRIGLIWRCRLKPLFELDGQPASDVRAFIGKVSGFTDVVAQVVKFKLVFGRGLVINQMNQFPIAGTYCIGRPMPGTVTMGIGPSQEP